MTILMLGSYFAPEIVAPIYLLENIAQDLAAGGHTVHVITAMPTRGVDEATQKQYRKMPTQVLEDGRLVIHRLRVPLPASPKSWVRALRYLYISLAVCIKAAATRADVAYIYSTPPTLPIFFVPFARIARLPTVLNLQDLFPDSLLHTGMSREGLLLRFLRRVERWMYRHTTRIAVITEDFRRHLKNVGVPDEKIDLCYNWVDENQVTPIPRAQNVLVKRYGLDPQMRYITYCGNIGHTQKLEALVDAAEGMRDMQDVRFVIVGNGAQLAHIKQYALDRGADNLQFLPFQPYEDIAHVFSLADISVITSKANIGRNSFPSKTWSVLSAARPVLAAFDLDSELCQIIERAQCGRTVPPEDGNAIEAALREMLADKPALLEMGARGRAFIEKELTRRAGTGRIAQSLEKAFARGRGRK